MNQVIESAANRHQILRELYRLTDGQTDQWEHLDKIAASINVKGDKFHSAYEHLKGENLIQQYGAGYTVHFTQEGIKYIHDLEVMEEKYLILDTLKFLRSSPNRYVSIDQVFDAVGVIEDEIFRKDLRKKLYRLELIDRANYDEGFGKISEKGRGITSATFDLLFIEKPSPESFNVTGSHNTIIYKSSNSNITLTEEEVKSVIPKLIELFGGIRNDDITLLSSAMQDIKDGKQIEAGLVERVTAWVANMTTILSAILPR